MQKILVKNWFAFDGDTLQITDTAGNALKTRALWVDSPEVAHTNAVNDEIDQNQWMWGNTAREYLRGLLANKHLMILSQRLDQYDRHLAFWYASSALPVRSSLANSIQIQMVNAGMATDFLPIYNLQKLSNPEMTLYCRILREQQDAYLKRRGFWADDNFMRPGDYRKLRSGII